jgi:hypothetical protein
MESSKFEKKVHGYRLGFLKNGPPRRGSRPCGNRKKSSVKFKEESLWFIVIYRDF